MRCACCRRCSRAPSCRPCVGPTYEMVATCWSSRARVCTPPSIAPNFTDAARASALANNARIVTLVLRPCAENVIVARKLCESVVVVAVVVDQALRLHDLPIDDLVRIVGAVRSMHDEPPDPAHASTRPARNPASGACGRSSRACKPLCCNRDVMECPLCSGPGHGARPRQR
jgi:hypothetical protein